MDSVFIVSEDKVLYKGKIYHNDNRTLLHIDRRYERNHLFSPPYSHTMGKSSTPETLPFLLHVAPLDSVDNPFLDATTLCNACMCSYHNGSSATRRVLEPV